MPVRRLVVLVVAAAGLLALAGGCGPGDSSTPAIPTFGSAIPPDYTALTNDTTNPLAFPAYSDPNTPIYAAVGKRFAIMVEANPSTGSHWVPVAGPDPAVVRPLGSQFLTANTALPGAPETEVLSYVTTGLGTTTIELAYSSVTDRSAPEQKVKFSVTVTLDGNPPPPPPETTLPTLPGRGR